MPRLRFVVPALALVAYAVALLQVQRLELDGPPTLWLELDGGIPAVLHLPGERQSFWPPPPPAPVGERPPAVLLVHGYSGDNPIMSGLARALTRVGYAVLTIEVRGHGRNRTRSSCTRSRSFPESRKASAAWPQAWRGKRSPSRDESTETSTRARR